MTEWRTLQVKVPILESCSDEELAEEMARRDGKWQPYIKAALLHFDAKGLQLEEHWAATAPCWSCPVCQREKYQILRLTGANILLASLHWHHDHSNDYIKDRLKREFGPRYSMHISRGSVHLESLGSTLIERFTGVVICIDCNLAEAKAKRELPQIHRKFTFRPAEIASFIKMPAMPHFEHQVDLDRALAIWEASKENFLERLELADLLIEKIKSGVLDRDYFPNRPRGWINTEPFIRDQIQKSVTSHVVEQIDRDLNHFWTRSMARDGVGSSNKRRRKGPTASPTDEEYAAHDGGGQPDTWELADEAWTCPVCNRSRREIMRRSTKPNRRWSGFIQRHNEYEIFQIDEEDDDFTQHDPSIESHQTLLICGDCATVATKLKQRKPEFSNADTILQVGDLKLAVTSAAHEPHEIDMDVVEQCVRDNRKLIPAIAAYWKHFHQAVEVRYRLKRQIKRYEGNERRAWTALVAFYREEWGYSETETADMIGHYLDEAERLAPEEGLDAEPSEEDGQQPELPPVS